ncbi:MAG TPA: ANTAR domain-containing protein [Actinophytocola sp.]|uniref:ANTAR domain-containing protein n=1 Tax=Actinophytocola sp. TaxID=1872138 RepID=UPI002DBCBCD5|nr:ANTAR domain-containing protein [Actinophytocola sp.]HEU5475496.1 ANTAR domain-containing protein [Actinophytocola sp.]
MDQVPSEVDMLDPTVQCLFGVSMELHGVLALIERNQEGQARQRVWSAIGQVDRAISQIRDVAVRLITTGHGAEQRVVEAFLATASALVNGMPLVDTLRPLLRCCVALLPVDAAGIVLARPRTLLAVEPDDAPLREFFRLYLDGPGPVPIEIDSAWPQLFDHARGMGISTVHAAPVRLRSDILGALVLPGVDRVCGFDDRILQGLADLAAVAILHEHAATHREQFVTQLELALSNQAIIEQAKGTLAERHHTTGAEAFQLMANRAAELKRPLLEVAQSVLDGTSGL